jgi:hypothetical protein
MLAHVSEARKRPEENKRKRIAQAVSGAQEAARTRVSNPAAAWLETSQRNPIR